MFVYVCWCGSFGFYEIFSPRNTCHDCGRRVGAGCCVVMNRAARERARYLLQAEKAAEEISRPEWGPLPDWDHCADPDCECPGCRELV